MKALKETHINSIVGAGCRIEGKINGAHFLRIDGDVIGSLSASGKIVVGKSARCEGSLYAKEISIGGVVRGDLIAEEKIIILSSAIVMGNIEAPYLVVEEGAVLHATCIVGMEISSGKTAVGAG
ncbi:polymer-forming cytoskeletal protein [Spirochaetia bacterium 38H-sp]|uniref:Polymer-forming cytoskeletal protein n=1 Tax=Rarispira pelagica TaxID=3141764 RepID=A0ABU9UDS0_9SPIR